MIVITGATGHIGNNLLRHCVAAGDAVRVLLRRDGEALVGVPVERAYGDIFDPAFLAAHVASGDVLVHLAATIDLTNRDAAETLRVNHEGTLRVARFCAEHGVRLVFVSSVDAIDKPQGHLPIAEPTAFHPERLKNVYARSKALATAAVQEMMAAGILDGCILYPSAVVGVNDFKPSAAGREIRRALTMKVAFYIRGGYNFIDVRDVATAIRTAIVTDFRGSCILAAHPVSVRGLYHAIALARGKRMLLVRVPVALARIGGLFMKGFSNVMIDALLENYDYDNALMRARLLPKPIPFTRTMADTIAWFQARNPRK